MTQPIILTDIFCDCCSGSYDIDIVSSATLNSNSTSKNNCNPSISPFSLSVFCCTSLLDSINDLILLTRLSLSLCVEFVYR